MSAALHHIIQYQEDQDKEITTKTTLPKMAPRNPLRLITMPLYGILIIEKSMLLGQRRLVKKHHARFLAPRVLGSRLPAELVDQIADDLADLEYADVLQLWRTLSSRKSQREAIFGLSEVYGTAAEQAAVTELISMSGGTLCARIVVTGTDGANAQGGYVHISASESRPNIAQVVPGPAPPFRPTLQYADGHLAVQCFMGTDHDLSIERTRIWPSMEKRQVSRLVQIDGIEEAIKRWDQEVVERYVKFLDLKVVLVNGEETGGLTPRLRLLQALEWT